MVFTMPVLSKGQWIKYKEIPAISISIVVRGIIALAMAYRVDEACGMES